MLLLGLQFCNYNIGLGLQLFGGLFLYALVFFHFLNESLVSRRKKEKNCGSLLKLL